VERHPPAFCRHPGPLGERPLPRQGGSRREPAAEWLLKSNDTISEVADRFEFSDVYNFSQQFKLHHGSSPRHYREKQRLLLLD